MRVRITKLQAGPFGVRTVGQEVDIHPKEAATLIAAGAAEALEAVAPVVELEQATAPEPEVESRPEPAVRKRRGRRSTSR